MLISIVEMDDKSSIFAKIFKLRDRKIKKQFIFRQLLFDSKKMFKTLLLTTIIIAISIALLSITIILKKNGRFPNTHVSGNKGLRKRGIKCAQSQDRDARRDNPMAVSESSKTKKQ